MSAENIPSIVPTDDESVEEFPDTYGFYEMDSSNFPFMAYDAVSDSWYEKWASEGNWLNPDFSRNSPSSGSDILMPQPYNDLMDESIPLSEAKSDNIVASSSQDANEFANQSNTESEMNLNLNDMQAPESGDNIDELTDDSEQALITDSEPRTTDGSGRILSYAKIFRICRTVIPERYKDIMSGEEIIDVVTVNEKLPVQDGDFNVEDIGQIPKLSLNERLKAVETVLRYFER
ncbi:hypothetical protein TNCV_1516691 [Trichonephila clavipes]|nr:hypothetical protein TNCV_1516691 [Trichonephila clavipes]